MADDFKVVTQISSTRLRSAIYHSTRICSKSMNDILSKGYRATKMQKYKNDNPKNDNHKILLAEKVKLPIYNMKIMTYTGK